MTTAGHTFTLNQLDWRSWLPVVDLDEANPEQLSVLDESNPKARTSDYYKLLVHDPEALRHRSRLFNNVMYASKGLPRADRELASVAVSRVNGCTYCASVHGRLFSQLTKDEDTILRIFDEGTDTSLSPRQRAIVDFSVALTRTPARLEAHDVSALRKVGLTDLEILDLIHVVAMFGWANRLLQTLGEPVPPESVHG
jgi:uncharacterized peroxidase-related enzyme